MNQSLRRVNPILIVGFVFLSAAGVTTYRYVHAPAPPKKIGNPAQQEVSIVATRDIAANQVVTIDLLKSSDPKQKDWTAGQLKQVNELVGKVAIRNIRAGDPVKSESVSATNGAALAHLFYVPPGLRALTVQTASAIAGQPELAHAGDRVDVLVLHGDSQGGQRSDTVAQDVPVLSIISTLPSQPPSSGSKAGAETTPSPTVQPSPPTVVLGVNPEQAENIAIGELTGKVRLTIRNPLDHTIYALASERRLQMPPIFSPPKKGSKAMTHRNDSSLPPYPGIASTRPRKGLVSVEVIRGTERSLLDVPKG